MTVSLETMRVSVSVAKEACSEYVNGLLSNYHARSEDRRKAGVKVVSFLGHGRAGKDESARLFGEVSYAKYGASTSWVMAPLIAHSLGVPRETAWENRHKDRMYWKVWCDEFRREDQTIISRMLLAEGDIIVGTRGKPEFFETMQTGVSDYVVWVDRPGIEDDPTMDYTKEDVLSFGGRAFVIENDGTVDDLRIKISDLAGKLQMLKGI